MEGSKVRAQDDHGTISGRSDAVDRSSSLLRREGFTVSRRRAGSSAKGRTPELVATNGARVVRAFILTDADVDSRETRRRLAAASRQGETRVFVRWPLRWRMLSNVERWGLRGVAVSSW